MKKVKKLKVFSLNKRKGKLSSCSKRFDGFIRLQINSMFVTELRASLKSRVGRHLLQTFYRHLLRYYYVSRAILGSGDRKINKIWT